MEVRVLHRSPALLFHKVLWEVSSPLSVVQIEPYPQILLGGIWRLNEGYVSKSGFKGISFPFVLTSIRTLKKINLLDNSSVIFLSLFPFQSCSFSLLYLRSEDGSSTLNLPYCSAQCCKSLWGREWGSDTFKVLVLTEPSSIKEPQALPLIHLIKINISNTFFFLCLVIPHQNL